MRIRNAKNPSIMAAWACQGTSRPAPFSFTHLPAEGDYRREDLFRATLSSVRAVSPLAPPLALREDPGSQPGCGHGPSAGDCDHHAGDARHRSELPFHVDDLPVGRNAAEDGHRRGIVVDPDVPHPRNADVPEILGPGDRDVAGVDDQPRLARRVQDGRDLQEPLGDQPIPMVADRLRRQSRCRGELAEGGSGRVEQGVDHAPVERRKDRLDPGGPIRSVGRHGGQGRSPEELHQGVSRIRLGRGERVAVELEEDAEVDGVHAREAAYKEGDISSARSGRHNSLLSGLSPMRGKHASRTERRSERGERGLRRASAWAGIVAPILFVALVAVESLLRPGYSQIADWVSYLGYGPNAALQDLNFLLFGALSIVVAIGLGDALPRTREASAQRAERLVAVSGVAVMIAGGSLRLVDALPAGVAFVTHTVGSFVAFGVLLVAMSVTARSLKDADGA